MHLAGRVFETPALKHDKNTNKIAEKNYKDCVAQICQMKIINLETWSEHMIQIVNIILQTFLQMSNILSCHMPFLFQLKAIS